MAEQLGRVLGGRYRLVAPIGTGASAQVFLADDVTLRRRVAVKVLHPALADDESFLRRFRAEARAAAAMSHPNVMAVYDWGEDDGPYLVLEYLGGGSLRALLDRGTLLNPNQAVVVGLDAARALDVAHRRGFVHRDIKPANLIFGDDGRLRIADFGLARALSEAAWTEPGDLVGTARYAAPEQAAGPRVDGKADVYALGLVLIEAVTGTVPLTADTGLATILGRVDRHVPVPESLGPLVPALEAAGHPVPAERPDAADFARALLGAARTLDRPEPLPLPGALPVEVTEADAGGGVDPTLLPRDSDGPSLFDDLAADDLATPAADTAADEPRLVPVERSRRRRWPWIVVALAVLAAAIGGGAWAWFRSQPASATVPDVDSQTLDEATATIAEVQAQTSNGGDDVAWEIVEQQRFNDGVAPGLVISQDPAAGTELDDGEAITLRTSRGPPPRAVPDVAGLTEVEAEAALVDGQLEKGRVSRAASEDVPVDRVVTGGVEGTDRPVELPRGSEIDLVLSSGPAVRVVPELAGRSADEARAELEGLSLGVAVEEEFSSSAEAGTVIRTDPGSGADVARDSSVTLLVSRGPDLRTVPSVDGLSIDAAVAAIEDAGLQAGEVSGPADGVAYITDPAAAARVDRGTIVDIFLRP